MMRFLLNLVGRIIWANFGEPVLWLRSMAIEAWLYLTEKPKSETIEPITNYRFYYDSDAFKHRPEKPEPETEPCFDPDDKEEDLPPVLSAFFRAFQGQ